MQKKSILLYLSAFLLVFVQMNYSEACIDCNKDEDINIYSSELQGYEEVTVTKSRIGNQVTIKTIYSNPSLSNNITTKGATQCFCGGSYSISAKQVIDNVYEDRPCTIHENCWFKAYDRHKETTYTCQNCGEKTIIYGPTEFVVSHTYTVFTE